MSSIVLVLPDVMPNPGLKHGDTVDVGIYFDDVCHSIVRFEVRQIGASPIAGTINHLTAYIQPDGKVAHFVFRNNFHVEGSWKTCNMWIMDGQTPTNVAIPARAATMYELGS